MKLIFNSSYYIRNYITPQKNLIIESIEFDKKENDTIKKLYKLNNFGNVIDEIHLLNDDNENYYKGYLINTNKEYYRTWALDGDTLKKKIEKQNVKLLLDKVKEMELYTSIKKNAKFYFMEELDNDIIYKEKEVYQKYYKIFYRINDKWKIICTNESFENEDYWESFYSKKEKECDNVFMKYQENSDERARELIPKDYKNVHFVYFQKIKRDGNWIGKLYSNLIIEKDTLKIKKTLELDSTPYTNQYPIVIQGDIIGYASENPYYCYQNKKLEYQLFTNDLRKIYIIKHFVKNKS